MDIILFLEQGNFKNMHEFHISANIHSLLLVHDRVILSCIIYVGLDHVTCVSV